MKKEYNLPEEEEDVEKNRVNELITNYGYQAAMDMEYSPTLTEEELRDSITGKELLTYIFEKIRLI